MFPLLSLLSLKISHCTSLSLCLWWREMAGCLRGREWDSVSFHRITQNRARCKISPLFISGIFQFIFSDHSRPWVTEVTGHSDKGALSSRQAGCCESHHRHHNLALHKSDLGLEEVRVQRVGKREASSMIMPPSGTQWTSPRGRGDCRGTRWPLHSHTLSSHYLPSLPLQPTSHVPPF